MMSGRILRGLLPIALLLTTVGSGQAQSFGQNKVQYKDLTWSVIETENFEIYFYDGNRETAMDAARMAERAYERLSTILNHDIEEKIPLILYASHADFQSTNVTAGVIGEGTGGLTEFLKRRVTLPFTGGYGDLDHVLTHELVHAFQIDMLFGKGSRGLANPFGAYTPPLWFMEGMAEYLSVTRVDENTEMWLRDAALQGYLIPLGVLSQVYDIRVYRFGQSIFAYIGRTFGDGRIGELMKRVARTRSVERAFQDVLGITLKKFSDDWMMDVRRSYLPQIRDYEEPSEFAKRLTNSRQEMASFHLAPAVSADGSEMVYLSDRSLYIDLYLASALDGKVQRRLVKGSRREEFESLRFLSASLDFSPDAETIAFVSKVGGTDAIYLVRPEDGKVVRKIQFDLDGIEHPSFSPDGEWLVFAGLDGGRSDLYRCRVDGSDFEQLTEDRFLATAPRYAPDGKSVVFVTDEDPDTDFENLIFADPRIGILDLQGRTVRVLGSMPGSNFAPHLFPDGNHLLYVSNRTGISNIFIRDLTTGLDAQITDILTGVTGVIPLAPAVSLSRDGRRVVFSAFSKGSWDLFAIKDPLSRAVFEEPAPIERPDPEGEIAFDSGLGGAPIDSLPIPLFEPDEAGELLASADPTSPIRADHPDSLGLALEIEEPEAAWNPELRGLDLEGRDVDEPPSLMRIGEVFALHEDLPDTNDFNVDRYKVKFGVDYAAANGFFAGNVGVAAQTLLQFSDVLGNHNLIIGASVYGSIEDSDLLFEYVNLANRINYGIAVFQLRDDFFLTTAENTDEFVSQIYRGLDLTISRPFSRFRRLELSVQGLQVDETVYREVFSGSNIFFSDPTEENSLYFVRPGVALVQDNVLYGWTGPISGSRSRYSADVSFGDVQTSRFVLDRRNYWNLRQRYAFALRMVGATSQGRDPQTFRIGGPYTVRGYEYGEFDGNHIAMANLEFRFPLIEMVQLGWPLPLGFQGVRGAIFFDAGSAWYDHDKFQAFGDEGSFRLEDIHASYGLNASINIGFAILRWDLAQRTNLDQSLGKMKGSFSIGTDF